MRRAGGSLAPLLRWLAARGAGAGALPGRPLPAAAAGAAATHTAIHPSAPGSWQAPCGWLPAAGLHSSRGASAADAAGGDAGGGDAPKRARCATAEGGRATRGRTTESRAAVEDVAIMTDKQLLRRNKPWLQEQCWQRGLPFDGTKEVLMQRLIEWQQTAEGQTAAEAARAAAREAVEAAHAARAAAAAKLGIKWAPAGAAQAPAAAAAEAPPAAQAAVAAAPAQERAAAAEQAAAPAAAAAPSKQAAAVPSPPPPSLEPQPPAEALKQQQAAAAAAPPPPPPLPSTSPSPPPQQQQQQEQQEQTQEQQQAQQRRDEADQAAAAGEVLTAALSRLRDRPADAAAAAAARNALEARARRLPRGAGPEEVAPLAAQLLGGCSPPGLAALARATYGREVQDSRVCAAVAAALAGAARQLGPHELHSALRLMAAHEHDTVRTGLVALAEALVRESGGLSAMQLSEVVALLRDMAFDDAWGLYLITKEASRRLQEFGPEDLARLVVAVADMHVGDSELGESAAAAAAARRGEYSSDQLGAVRDALRRMGCDPGDALAAEA
ncbi:hypothetical protein Rsub_05326 [Raphidocelis subcapitata]|uniref:SAP domain-containing protein n=1 Tax=Raphidocelis subcapitata TaxID=307507 RepID=A0A2V0P312_9CHLO|nr:hypothetical protein Rsub_05326 [Raphidocelis subcapitata]|eukprot:GBF92243.1 hypothetical protein Rsub_05326 [Raphidocelis subcapitata]